MTIDFHTHTFPEEIAEKTIPMLAKTGNIKNYTNGTQKDLKVSMKESGINYSVLMPISTKPTQTEKLNMLAAKSNETSSKTGLISFGSVHPDNENYKELLKEAHANGIKGIKLHPYYQNTPADDERYVRIVDTIETLGMITIFHAGLDIGFEGQNMAAPEQFYNLYMKLKPQKLVLAHMGGWRMWNEVEEKLCSLPIYFDTSFTLASPRRLTPVPEEENALNYIPGEQFLRIVKYHGADKILFGSDSPWSEQKESLDILENIGLEQKELELIEGKNAEKLLNL